MIHTSKCITRAWSSYVAKYSINVGVSGYSATGQLFDGKTFIRNFSDVKINASNTFAITVSASGLKIRFKLEK